MERVAIITGAARGIGRATALQLAGEGVLVSLADISDEVGAVADAITSQGGTAISNIVDVSSSESVEQLVQKTIDHFGQLDILHNNAGTTGQSACPGPLGQLSDADFDRVLRVNLYSAFYGTKHALPHFIAQGNGVIVNTASIWGVVGASNFGAYSAAKHGLIGLTRSTSADYAQLGIRANAVVPGPVRIDGLAPADLQALDVVVARTHAGRIGEPAEIAKVVAWLCSPSASYVNGACVTVDGGWLAS